MNLRKYVHLPIFGAERYMYAIQKKNRKRLDKLGWKVMHLGGGGGCAGRVM